MLPSVPYETLLYTFRRNKTTQEIRGEKKSKENRKKELRFRIRNYGNRKHKQQRAPIIINEFLVTLIKKIVNA